MNSKDPFAVAVVKSQVAVGHIPRKISSICSMFLRHGGTICCRVTGSRRYSQDLPQGGLEIPCMLTFRGEAKDIENERVLAARNIRGSKPIREKRESYAPRKYSAIRYFATVLPIYS